MINILPSKISLKKNRIILYVKNAINFVTPTYSPSMPLRKDKLIPNHLVKVDTVWTRMSPVGVGKVE